MTPEAPDSQPKDAAFTPMDLGQTDPETEARPTDPGERWQQDREVLNQLILDRIAADPSLAPKPGLDGASYINVDTPSHGTVRVDDYFSDLVKRPEGTSDADKAARNRYLLEHGQGALQFTFEDEEGESKNAILHRFGEALPGSFLEAMAGPANPNGQPWQEGDLVAITNYNAAPDKPFAVVNPYEVPKLSSLIAELTEEGRPKG
jgi:hypothetical protein